MFALFNMDKFFSFGGVKYGVLVFEGHNNFPVFTISQAQAVVQIMVKKGHIPDYKASNIISVMRSEGVCETATDVYEKFMEVELPEDFRPEFDFKLHSCLNPLPHGNILAEVEGGENITNEVIELIDVGFLVLLGAVKVHEHQRLYILKEMIKSGLPQDQVEWNARFSFQPLEVRRRYETANAPFHSDHPES